MISGIESLTVGVRDLAAALSLFRDRMGFRVETDVRASVSLLVAWKLPVHSDLRLVTLSMDGYPFGRIRLAGIGTGTGSATRLDFGPDAVDRPTDVVPKALHLYTGSPITQGLDALVAAGCTARGEPVPCESGPNDT